MENYKIYKVHYAINNEEHDYLIEAMSASDALDSCWFHNAFRKEGEDTYIDLYVELITEEDLIGFDDAIIHRYE